ncbi:endonuclease/exonuclease/phosphatase family protein [Cellvibrio sp.]|uniref:endonuclease/exonuclease/phosphatase family protein n=1 Tax=Cellvibrio sp. TaxID=1965322 RepID=UPI00396474FC
MRIVSWNCNGALRNKTKLLDDLNADILVIQECENPEISNEDYKKWAGTYLWAGKNKNKGIGVFARNEHKLMMLDWAGEFRFKIEGVNHRSLNWQSEQLESFLPCMIDNRIPLLAVWTKQVPSKSFSYIGQLWIYLQIHKAKLDHPNQIICGDFNSNKMWDEEDRLWNHSDVVAELKNMGLESLYHTKTGEAQGRETRPTFFLHRNREKPYHIDHVYIRSDKIQNSTLKFNNADIWLKYSDHLPIEFET